MKVQRTMYIDEKTDSILDAMKRETGQGKGKLVDLIIGDNFDLMKAIQTENEENYKKYMRMMAFR